MIIEILRKCLISLAIALFFTCIASDLESLGDSRFQSVGVLTFYIYCVLILFTSSSYRLFHVLSIPVLTQFLHIFQKYAFAAGANSIWRLIPFLLLDLYFVHFFTRNQSTVAPNQKAFVCFWILLQSIFLLISPNLDMIIAGAIIMYLVTIPFFFLYLHFVVTARDLRPELDKYLFLLFVILGTGTFGLIHFGALYKGSDNLLVTRNIADTNVTMAYFILLWPFALNYANRQRFASLLTFALTSIFISIVVFSFSRGAVLLVIPYVALTLFIHQHYLKWLIPTGFLIFINQNLLNGLVQDLDLSYFWSLRFGDIFSSDAVWDKIQAASGRMEIQQTAYDLFLQKPLSGYGTGSFEILGPGFREAHSLFYTLLAEQGMIGAIYFYSIFAYLMIYLFSVDRHETGRNVLMPISFLFYFLFNHTVGSVFVILPAKSISINCIAPVLLMCMYFYKRNATFNKYLIDQPGIDKQL